MLIVLDNAESIVDPQGASAREIYADVDELTKFKNICLLITSCISTIPPGCETLEIPTLPVEAARDTFHRIHKHGERSNSIDDILEQLDCHPLSITSLATVAQQNKWSTDRLAREWSERRTAVLTLEHSRNFAATIELSLVSPTFQELGPDAREFLKVVAFLPQGIDEKNVRWQFPTISNAPTILDKFCVLSLTYRRDDFITMLAPHRDHLRPEDPTSSPLLNATKEYYFNRLSGDIPPEEARWITSEDVNVELLLDVFTTTDGNSKIVWDVCAKFMAQLFCHKPRLVMLGPKIEALPDDHPPKAQRLFELSQLFQSVGNAGEQKRLLSHALELRREKGNDLSTDQRLKNPASSLSRVRTHTSDDGPPFVIHPVPDSSDHLGLDAPACRRLINSSLSPQQVISLIGVIFTSKDEVAMIRDLRGDDPRPLLMRYMRYVSAS